MEENDGLIRRAHTYATIARKRFKTLDFAGSWLLHIGKPELRGSWFVYGGSGHGKTTYHLQLTKYLCDFVRVHINTLEEGMRESFRLALERANMRSVAKRFAFQSEGYSALELRLERQRSAKVVVIDSAQYFFRGKTINAYWELLDKFPDKLFVIISQADGNQPKGKLADAIRYHSDVKVFVKDYCAHIEGSRYGGHAPHIIWEAGYDARQAKLLKPKSDYGG